MRPLLWLVVLAIGITSVAHAAPASSKPARAGRPSTVAAAKWQPVVPFIEDDFGRALALAKERKLPVFIEGWAPW